MFVVGLYVMGAVLIVIFILLRISDPDDNQSEFRYPLPASYLGVWELKHPTVTCLDTLRKLVLSGNTMGWPRSHF